MADPVEQKARFEKWARSLPQCISDEGGCDGNLVGLPHEENCPMLGKERATHLDAWAAAERSVVSDIVASLQQMISEAEAHGFSSVGNAQIERLLAELKRDYLGEK